MEINSISFQPNFRGADEVQENEASLLKGDAEPDKFEKKPITAEKIVAAGVAGSAAIEVGKKSAEKVTAAAESQLKEAAKDFVKKPAETAAEKAKEVAETVKGAAEATTEKAKEAAETLKGGKVSGFLQGAKKFIKTTVAKVGDCIKKFRAETLPKFAENGFSQTQKATAKWLGGISAGIAAAVAVLRDKDKDGKSDLFEAIHVLFHPEKVNSDE